MTLLPMLLAEAYHYRPFITPSPWFFGSAWWVLLVPLSLGIAIVYKSVRCNSMKRVPREAAGLFVVILVVMTLAAGGLWLLTRVLESAG